MRLGLIITIIALILSSSAFAQEEQSLANKTANPLGGDFLLVINQFDYIERTGPLVDKNPGAPSNPTLKAYTLQPVISAPLDNVIGPGYSVVVRPTTSWLLDSDIPKFPGFGEDPIGFPNPPNPPPPIPPVGGIPFEATGGFLDPSVFGLVGKTIPTQVGGGGAFVVGAGLAAGFPWGNSKFSSNQYTAGPAAVATYLGKPGVFGALGQQFWSYADDGTKGASDVNKSLVQIFYYLNLTEQWQLGAAPLWQLDWENDSYEIPLGLGLTYTGQILPNLPPVKTGFEFQTYADTNDFLGNDWGFKFFLIPILPSPMPKLAPGLYE